MSFSTAKVHIFSDLASLSFPKPDKRETPIEDEHGFGGLTRMFFKPQIAWITQKFWMRPSTSPFDRLRVRREQAHKLALIFANTIRRKFSPFGLYFRASPLVLPALWASPPPCHPLLFSVLSLIAVGDAIAAIGIGAIGGDAMTTGKPMLLCYCYFVTFSILMEITTLRNNIPY
ncbi:MAG: hypothetical protein KBT57_09490 [bacterium]|nr:hypothetical protein [Candidatus Limimorpha equi]